MKRKVGTTTLVWLLAVSLLLAPFSGGIALGAPGDPDDRINVALGKTVSASSSYEMAVEGWAMANLVDGYKTGPRAPGMAENGFTTRPAASQPPAGSPAWVMVDLGAVYGTEQIVLWPRSDNGTTSIGGGFPIDFRVLVSGDGDSWTEIDAFTDFPMPADGNPLVLDYDPLPTRYVKVEATRLRGVTGELVMQFRELEVFQADSGLPDQEVVNADRETLTLPVTQDLFSSLQLPSYGLLGSAITWSSSRPEVVGPDGKVVRPAAGEPVAEVTLTATLTRGDATATKSFELTVRPHRERDPQPEDEFLIGIFWPPTWEFTNDQQYQWIKEANVDIVQNVLGSGLDTEERNMRMLELAERHDLKINVADPRIRGTDEQIREVVETYKDYWGTGGYYIRDEPSIGELEREAHIYKEVLKHDDSKNPYVNLFPNIYGNSYEPDYVRKWVELVGKDNLKYLSYDNYPFLQNGTFSNGYYDMADIIRRVGLDNDIRTASYLQSVGYGPSPGNLSHRRPTETDMRFSVYSYLAYGFKYVTWFTYWTPTGRGEHFENAIIDPNGNKTDLYEPFSRLNGEMKQLGKTLIHLDALEVFHAGEVMPTSATKRVPDTFYVTPVHETDEMIISYMVERDTNETYVMIVNKSFTETQTYELRTNGAVADVKEISKTTGLPVEANYDAAEGIFTDTFLPGEGKLYALGVLPPFVGPQPPHVLPEPESVGNYPLSNLALRQPVTASSDIGLWGWSRSFAVDGVTVGGAGADDPKGWTSVPTRSQPTSPAWIAIDLGRSYQVDKVVLWPRNDAGSNRGVGFPVDYSVQLSVDGTNWTTAASRVDQAMPADGAAVELTFPAETARYVKIEATRLRVDPNGEYAMQLAEIEVFQEVPDTMLVLQADKVDLLVGETAAIAVSQWQPDETLQALDNATFESAAPDVATVDESGVVTAVGAGTAAIKVEVPLEGGGVDRSELIITVRSLDEPWTAERAGHAKATIIPSGGSLELQSSGTGLGEADDHYTFVRRPVEGRLNELTATLAFQGVPGASGAEQGRSGLLFKQEDNAALVYLAVSPEGRLELTSRTASGETNTVRSASYFQLPVELKLVQTRHQFTGYYKLGDAWQPIAGSVAASTLDAEAAVGWTAGAATYSGVADALNKVVFEGLALSATVPDSEDIAAVEADAAAIDLGNLTAVAASLTLPQAGASQTAIYWTSSNPEYMGHDGTLVKRPAAGQPDVELTLTAVVTKGAAEQTREFPVTIKALPIPPGPNPGSPPPASGGDEDEEPEEPGPEDPGAEGPDDGHEGPAPVELTDIAGHWAQAAIERAVQLGIVTGYDDGTFQPAKPVGRDEFVAMIARLLKLEDDGPLPAFRDLDSIQGWARPYVAGAIAAGIVNGYSDDTFRPSADISRVEMTAMIARALGLRGNGEAALPFADAALIPQWAVSEVAAVYEAGIVNGRGGNRFAPLEKTTRAEAVTMLIRLAEYLDSRDAE